MRVYREKASDRIFFGSVHGILKLEVISESYLFVGSGKISFKIDENIVKSIESAARESYENFLRKIEIVSSKISFDYKGLTYIGGRPAIPGSSVKGAVRSRLELLFHGINNIVPSCFIVQTRPPRNKPARGTHGWRHYEIWGDVIFEPRDTCNATKAEYFRDIKVCPVCNMFGTSGLSSRVFFDDFYTGDENIEVLRMDFDDSVEAIKPGSVFNGSILVDLNPDEVGLLSIGMNLLNGKPILIGYSKYRKRRKNNDLTPIALGRIVFRPVELILSQYSNIKENMSEERLTGSRLVDFLRKCEYEARKKWNKWLRDINEVEKLEQLS